MINCTFDKYYLQKANHLCQNKFKNCKQKTTVKIFQKRVLETITAFVRIIYQTLNKADLNLSTHIPQILVMAEHVFLCRSVISAHVCEPDTFKNCASAEWTSNNEGFYFWKLVKMTTRLPLFGYIFDYLVYSAMLCRYLQYDADVMLFI